MISFRVGCNGLLVKRLHIDRVSGPKSILGDWGSAVFSKHWLYFNASDMGHRLAKCRLPCDFLTECGKVEWETEPSAVMSLSLFVLRRHTLLLLRFGCKPSPFFLAC